MLIEISAGDERFPFERSIQLAYGLPIFGQVGEGIGVEATFAG
jgi:hypothetical protein